MEIKRLFSHDCKGNCHTFNYKGKRAKAAVHASLYGAGVQTLSKLVGRRRAKSLMKVNKNPVF